jgi:hypothetical protein
MNIFDKLSEKLFKKLTEKPVSSTADDPDRQRFLEAMGPAAGIQFVKEDTQVLTRPAKNLETKFVQRVRDVCVQNLLIRACWLLEFKKPEGGPIQLFIALDLAAPDKDLPGMAAKFQAMLREFPERAPKTFMISADDLDLSDTSNAVYVKK